MNLVLSLTEGRLDRKTYVSRTLVVGVITLILFAVRLASPVMFYIGYVLCNAYLTVQTVLRLHDLGRRGSLALLSFVPGVNTIFMLYLWGRPGMVGENLYGPDPCDWQY